MEFTRKINIREEILRERAQSPIENALKLAKYNQSSAVNLDRETSPYGFRIQQGDHIIVKEQAGIKL